MTLIDYSLRSSLAREAEAPAKEVLKLLQDKARDSGELNRIAREAIGRELYDAAVELNTFNKWLPLTNDITFQARDGYDTVSVVLKDYIPRVRRYHIPFPEQPSVLDELKRIADDVTYIDRAFYNSVRCGTSLETFFERHPELRKFLPRHSDKAMPTVKVAKARGKSKAARPEVDGYVSDSTRTTLAKVAFMS